MKKITAFFVSIFFGFYNSNAQDYQISFAGTGASTTLETVKVENLTQGKSITISGSDVLRLMATVTGLDKSIDDVQNSLRIFPNPIKDFCTIQFLVSASANTTLEIFDIAGKKVSKLQQKLEIGTHSFQISNLSTGIYTIKIHSPSFSYSGKLISNKTTVSGIKINYQGMVATTNLKSAKTEKTMQYTTGNKLKITGTSGNFSTVVIDVPTESKIITFNLIACTDADGNHYPVVKIGNQTWMGENLKTTKYRDGSLIPNVTNNTSWIGLTTGAYCWYNHDINNKNTYGALYNYFAAIDNHTIAPTGWHVPSEAEWTTLINFLGGESVAGGKIKETKETHWRNPNTGATNETGFTALPGGSRARQDGTFNYITTNGQFWTFGIPSLARGRGIGYNYIALYSEELYPTFGFSIRCIKD